MKVIWRRRREGKTNYRRRKKAILSRKPLLYVFVSNKNVYVQVIKPEMGGDKVLASASSKDLVKMGWKFGCKSLPAAYLVGLIIGKKAKNAGIKEAILYTGVKKFISGSRVAAVVKGAIDSGLEIPFDEDAAPNEERILGKHIIDYYNMLKESDQEAAKKQFSSLSGKGIESLPEEVEKFKTMILGGEGED